MWLTWILDNWRIALAGLASLLILMLYSWGVTMKMERDAKIAEINSIRNAAQTYKDQSEQNRRVINESIPLMVEQAKSEAWRNWQAKFGNPNAACGIRTDGLLPPQHGTGQASGAERTDDTERIRLAIEGCARDAGRLDLWIKWAEMNQLPVQ